MLRYAEKRMGVQHPFNKLGHHVTRRGEHIIVCRQPQLAPRNQGINAADTIGPEAASGNTAAIGAERRNQIGREQPRARAKRCTLESPRMVAG